MENIQKAFKIETFLNKNVSESGQISHVSKKIIEAMPKVPTHCPLSSLEEKQLSASEPSLLVERKILSMEEISKDSFLELGKEMLTGGLCTGTEVKIGNHAEQFKILQHLLKETDPTKKEMQQLIDYAAAVAKHSKSQNILALSQQYAAKIKDLKVGESQLVYTAHQGISQICRFTKQENGSLKIDLYTPMITSLTNTVLAGDKLRREYHFVYENVPQEMIRDNFIRSLIERNRSYKDAVTVEKMPLTPDHFLIPFSEMEKEGLRKSSSMSDGLMTGPRGQTSMASVIKAFLRPEHKDLVSYKKAIFQLKVDFLCAFFHYFEKSLQEDSREGKEIRHILMCAARNISRAAGKFVEGSISIEEKKESLQLCREIIAHVNEANQTIKNQRKEAALKIQNLDLEKQKAERKEYFEKNLKPITPLSAPVIHPLLPVVISKEMKADAFIEQTKMTVAKYLKLKGSDSLSLNLEIAALIDQLPIPKITQGEQKLCERLEKGGFWSELTLEKKQEAVKYLAQMMELYIQKSGQSSSFKQDELVRFYKTGLTLLVQVHYLACEIDREKEKKGKASLLNYSLASFADCLSQYEDVIYFDSKQFTEISKLQTYLKEINLHAQKEIFSQERNFRTLSFSSVPETGPNTVYWKQLLKEDPQLAKAALERFNLLNIGGSTESTLSDETKQILGLELDYWGWEPENVVSYESKTWGQKSQVKSNLISFGYGHVYALRESVYHLRRSLLLYRETGKVVPSFGRLECKKADELNEDEESYRVGSKGSDYNKHQIHPQQKRKLTYYYSNEIFSPQHRDYFTSLIGYNANKLLSLAFKKNFSENDQAKFESEILKMTFSDTYEAESIKKDRESNYRLLSQQKIHAEEALEQRETNFSAKKKFLQQIFRTIFALKTSSSQLITEFSQGGEYLEDPAMQTLFFRLFFRPTNIDNKESYGAGESLVENSLLREQCLSFIQEGISRCSVLLHEFSDEQGDKNANENVAERREKAVAKLRFYNEFSFYISKYLKDGGKPELAQDFEKSKEITAWIKQSRPSPKEAAVMHQSRLLFLSLKPLEELTDDEIIQCYESIACYRLSEDGNDWKSPEVSFVCDTFILRLTSHIQDKLKEPQFIDKLAAVMMREDVKGMKWEPKNPAILSNDQCTINLSTGVIFKEGFQEVYGCSNPKWEDTPFFQRLFGTQTFYYTSLGKESYKFEHPQWGSFKITKDNEGYYALCCRFPNDDRWFRYQKCQWQRTKAHHSCSAVLWSDYAYWIPEDDKEKHLAGYFTKLGSHTRAFQALKDGSVEVVNNLQGEMKSSGIFVDYFPHTDEALGDFENGQCVHLYRSTEGQIKQWRFPRFVSAERTPLVFNVIKKEESEEIVWSANVGYTLSTKPAEGYFGGIKGYLQLDPKDNNESTKLIVPFQFVNDCSFNKKLPPMKMAEYEVGAYQYFVFDVRQGEPAAVTLEGRLFHAYLHSKQKNYTEAAALLRGLMAVENLSPTAQKILEMIRENELSEDHPDAKIVVLHALLLQFKEDRKLFKKTEFEKESIEKALKGYLQSVSNVSSSVRFTLEEELFLIKEILQRGVSTELKKQLKRRQELIDSLDKKGNVSEKFEKRIEKKFGAKSTFGASSYHAFSENYPLNTPYWFGFSMFRDSVAEKFDKGTYLDSCVIDKEYQLGGNFALIKMILQIAKEGDKKKIEEEIFKLSQWLMLRGTSDAHNSNDLCLLLCILHHPKDFEKLNIENLNKENAKTLLIELESIFKKKREEIEEQRKEKQKNENSSLKIDLKPTDISSKIEYAFKKENSYDLSRRQRDDFGNQLPFSKKLNNDKCFSIDLPKHVQRWKKLDKWKNYLKIEKKKGQDLSLVEEEDLEILKERENEHGVAFDIDLKRWKEDYKAGIEQNSEERLVSIENEKAKKFLEEIENENNKVRTDIQDKTAALLMLANKGSKNETKFASEKSALQGDAKKYVTFNDCLECLLNFDFRSYKMMNSHLNKAEAELLAKMTLEIEELKSYQAQLSRLNVLLEQIVKIDGKIKTTQEEKFKETLHRKRESICNRLLVEVEAKYFFDDIKENFKNDEDFKDVDLDLGLHIIFHVFCGESGMIPFKKQIGLLVKMLQDIKKAESKEEKRKIYDRVIQLIMGGGKTSVIATIASFALTALFKDEKDQEVLSIFIVPSHLLNSVKINLGTFIKKAFKKDLHCLDFDLSILGNIKNLQEIEAALQRSIDKNEPVITTPKTLQCIQLEFARLMEMYFGTDSDAVKYNDGIQKLKSLARILKLLKEKGYSLTDEIDMILDALQEVNFPLGDPEPIKPEINHLIHQIYSIYMDDKVKIGDTSIVEVMKLNMNKQELLKESYKEKVIPVVAKKLIHKSRRIKAFVKNEHEDSFVRFATGNMHAQIQVFADMQQTPDSYEFDCWQQSYKTLEEVKADVEFLLNLRKWRHEGGETEEGFSKKEVADLIAWTRHILTVVTPTTLSKSGNDYYGLDPKAGSDKIIRYLGPGIPGTTKFGYFLEETCYFYQYVIAFGITAESILRYTKRKQEFAVQEAELREIPLNQTKAYKEFVEFFRCDFTDMQKVGKAQEVSKDFFGNKQKTLDFQKWVVESNVGVIVRRLASNGLNMMEQLYIKLSQSGTPWNVEGFMKSLLDGLIRDKGTLGKILHKMIERSDETPISVIEPISVACFLDAKYKNHTRPKDIRTIIDAAGFFKDIPGGNEEIAKEYLKWLKNAKTKGWVDEKIKAVLYFDREEGSTEYNTLFAYKMEEDAFVKVKIGGTSAEDLKAQGLTIDEIVAYLDPYHTTGIDIPFPDLAIAVMTFSSMMTERDMAQALMRMRKYFEGQRVEPVITKADEAYFIKMFFGLNKEGKKLIIKHLICAAWYGEFSKKVSGMVRYFDQQINNIFRANGLESCAEAILNSMSQEEIKKIYQKSRSYIVSESSFEGYDVHGRLGMKVDCKEMLKNKLMKKFKNQASPKHLEDKVKTLKNHIETVTCLPKEWEVTQDPKSQETTAIDEMNVEFFVEALQENQNQSQQNTQSENETQMQNELQTESTVCGRGESLPASENKMDNQKFFEIIASAKNIEPNLYSLQKKLEDSEKYVKSKLYKSEKINLIQAYGKVFSKPIYGSDNYFRRTENVNLSIFHPTQKPAKQILVVRTKVEDKEEFRWVLLTEKEANDAVSYLEAAYAKNKEEAKNVWLIGPNGNLFVDHDHLEPFPWDHELVLEGLIEINALLGRANYLDANVEYTERWLEKDTNQKMRFLAMKTRSTKEQVASEGIHQWDIGIKLREDFRKKKENPKLAAVKVKRKKHNGYFVPKSTVEAKLIEQPYRIKNLDPNFIPYLGIDPKAADETTLEAILVLKNKYGEQNWESEAARITETQFKNLWNHQSKSLKKNQDNWMKFTDSKKMMNQRILPLEEVQKFNDAIESVNLETKKVEELKKMVVEPKKMEVVEPKKVDEQIADKAPAWLSIEEQQNWSRVRKLSEAKEIQKVSFWHVQYMKNDQLKQRTRLQRFTYVVGITILGSVTAPFALVSFVGFKVLFISRMGPFKWTLNKLKANPIRLGAYLGTYVGYDWFKPQA